MVSASNPSGDPNFGRNKAKIRAWLSEEGWSIKEETPPGCAWGLIATDEGGKKLAFAQKPNFPDQTLIQGTVALDPQTKERFAELPGTERREFTISLVKGLISLGVLIGPIAEPFENVIVTQRIYNDGLTKDAFYQRADIVRNGVVLVLLELNLKFNTPPPQPPEIGLVRPR